MFRTVATAALTLMLVAPVVPAAAAGHQAGTGEPDVPATLSPSTSGSLPGSALLTSAGVASPLATDVDWSLPPVNFAPRRGAALPVLYISLAGLNAFDAYSTTKGVSKGASESNPLMRGAANNPAAMWAIKAGVTGGAIVIAERLWRRDKRVQAIAVMLVSNGMMAAVTARNASVLRRQSR